MKNRVNSLWTLFQERRLSRRTFMKSCVALTAILGLPPTMLDTVVKAAETTELPTVIWLHGHDVLVVVNLLSVHPLHLPLMLF